MLFQIMQSAEANDVIQKNPVPLAKKVRMNDAVTRKDSFTRDEVRDLFMKLPNDMIGNAIRLMICTGLRTQELLALTRDHISGDCSVIYVRQAITVVGGKPYIGSTKTTTSVRDAPVPCCAQGVLSTLLSRGTKYIVSNSSDKFMSPASFRKQFANHLRDIETVRLLTPHCCRHTYVSMLQTHGVDMETIQGLVGHTDFKMTEKYLHVQREQKIKSVNLLGDLVG